MTKTYFRYFDAVFVSSGRKYSTIGTKKQMETVKGVRY